MKGRNKGRNAAKTKAGYSPDHHMFTSSVLDNKDHTFDYLQSKQANRVDLSRTTNKNELDINMHGESPNFSKNTNGAISNLGIYNNKTFYTVNQPKRAGTTLATYQEDMNRKRAIKKFRNKINVPNTSSSVVGSIHPTNPMKGEINFLSTGQHKMSMKGNEKIFLPINEVLNQARKDQNANNQTLSDIIKNLSSTRKNKPSLLENINNAIDKGMIEMNKSKPVEFIPVDQSLTKEDIQEITKNLNLMNIQKSVLGSAGADKREMRPHDNLSSDQFNTSVSKKSSSS